MTISDEIEAFIHQHRGEARRRRDRALTERLSADNYLPLRCHVFVRWVTPEDTALDLAARARRN
jgi:hypothetical protein